MNNNIITFDDGSAYFEDRINYIEIISDMRFNLHYDNGTNKIQVIVVDNPGLRERCLQIFSSKREFKKLGTEKDKNFYFINLRRITHIDIEKGNSTIMFIGGYPLVLKTEKFGKDQANQTVIAMRSLFNHDEMNEDLVLRTITEKTKEIGIKIESNKEVIGSAEKSIVDMVNILTTEIRRLKKSVLDIQKKTTSVLAEVEAETNAMVNSVDKLDNNTKDRLSKISRSLKEIKSLLETKPEEHVESKLEILNENNSISDEPENLIYAFEPQ